MYVYELYICQMESMKEALSQNNNDDVMAGLRDVTHLRAKVDGASNSGM